MTDKVQTDEMKITGELPVATPTAGAPGIPGAAGTPGAAPGTPPRRSPGHRGADMRDTMAEMAARAQEISLEAGSKIAGAMKDVINAAAGLTGFAIESARDLVQYMVRRGQMTQEEADKILHEAEEAAKSKKPVASAYPQVKAAPAAAAPSAPATSAPAIAGTRPTPTPATTAKAAPAPALKKPTVAAPAAKSAAKSASSSAARPTAKSASSKPAAKAPAKAVSKGASKPATKGAAKSPAKSASKAAAKPAVKKPAAKKK